MSQPPLNQPPFDPQFPQQGPQGPYPQSSYPSQYYPQQPPVVPSAPTPSKKKAWYKKPWGIVLIIFLALVACGGIRNAISATGSRSTSNGATPTNTPISTTPIPQTIHYPPKTLVDLRGLAAEGIVNAIHPFHSESVGLTGACPQPKREVTVDPNVTGK